MSVGLVLEGGGTRGAYTAGVLDVFLEQGIEFPSVYGVSAGACNGMSYVSKQPKRNFNIFYNYVADERYLSVTSLRKTGSIFGFDFIFGDLSKTLLPFDYETFFASPVQFRVGVTNMETGRALFFGKEDMKESMDVVRASSSMPMVSPIVHFKGYQLMDGGIADPIPIERSIFDGNEYNVVVLTRDATYRKRARAEFPRAVLKAVYGDYPHMIDAMMVRSETYNMQLEVCRRQELSQKAVVVRPSSPIVTGRYEKNPDKLAAIYQMGVKDAVAKLEEIKQILKQTD